MAGTRRWIRLDVGWEDSWLEDVSGAAAGCWPRLLCWVKRDGVRGRCKRPRTDTLARRWRVHPEDVTELEAAAVADGALTIHNDHWTVVNWESYQGDAGATERQQRSRRNRKNTETSGMSHGVTDVTRDNGMSRESQPVTDLLSRATPTGTPREEKNPSGSKRRRRRPETEYPEGWMPSESHEKKAKAAGLDLPREAEKFRTHHTSKGSLFRDWGMAFHTWLDNAAEWKQKPKPIAGLAVPLPLLKREAS